MKKLYAMLMLGGAIALAAGTLGAAGADSAAPASMAFTR